MPGDLNSLADRSPTPEATLLVPQVIRLPVKLLAVTVDRTGQAAMRTLALSATVTAVTFATERTFPAVRLRTMATAGAAVTVVATSLVATVERAREAAALLLLLLLPRMAAVTAALVRSFPLIPFHGFSFVLFSSLAPSFPERRRQRVLRCCWERSRRRCHQRHGRWHRHHQHGWCEHVRHRRRLGQR